MPDNSILLHLKLQNPQRKRKDNGLTSHPRLSGNQNKKYKHPNTSILRQFDEEGLFIGTEMTSFPISLTKAPTTSQTSLYIDRKHR